VKKYLFPCIILFTWLIVNINICEDGTKVFTGFLVCGVMTKVSAAAKKSPSSVFGSEIVNLGLKGTVLVVNRFFASESMFRAPRGSVVCVVDVGGSEVVVGSGVELISLFFFACSESL
jgi:membrane-bound ClpP family serine protease